MVIVGVVISASVDSLLKIMPQQKKPAARNNDHSINNILLRLLRLLNSDILYYRLQLIIYLKSIELPISQFIIVVVYRA